MIMSIGREILLSAEEKEGGDEGKAAEAEEVETQGEAAARRKRCQRPRWGKCGAGDRLTWGVWCL